MQDRIQVRLGRKIIFQPSDNPKIAEKENRALQAGRHRLNRKVSRPSKAPEGAVLS